MIVLALSSGTSVDAIDVATAELTLTGDSVSMRPLRHHEVPFSAQLRAAVLDALPPANTTLEQVCRIDTLLGQEFAAAAGTVGTAGGRPDLVVSHGQTLYHWVDGGEVRGTLQLGQPAWVAEATGLPVISDVRVNDVAAGGQGAPLAAILDLLLLGGRPAAAAALNLGGIANVTVAGGAITPIAFDSGPGNALLDAAVRRDGDGLRDEGGARAARGRVHPGLLDVLSAHPYFCRSPPKSTGKELFHLDYLTESLRAADAPELSLEDQLATLVELTARTVSDALESYRVTEVLVSGGGTGNATLMNRLATLLRPATVRTTDTIGLDPSAKEAYLFALLGFLTWHGLPGVVPECTGARHATVAGRITPGSGPLRLPEPEARSPTRLHISDS